MFDTHFHLDPEDNAEEIYNNARSAGVEYMTLIGCDPESCDRAINTASKFENMFFPQAYTLYMSKTSRVKSPILITIITMRTTSPWVKSAWIFITIKMKPFKKGRSLFLKAFSINHANCKNPLSFIAVKLSLKLFHA